MTKEEKRKISNIREILSNLNIHDINFPWSNYEIHLLLKYIDELEDKIDEIEGYR